MQEQRQQESFFSFPAKVKQIGGIDDEMKLYMEDYVYTYLYQYGKSSGHSEKLAALVGRQLKIDDLDVILISGAIQAKNVIQENGNLQFSADTWAYIGSQLEMYFRGLTIVGWVHCQAGFGAFITAKDEAFHKLHFKEPWQVLFVMDTIDQLDAFYRYNKEQSSLQQARGYFVYYEKNEQMQEYMLDHSFVKPKETSTEQEKQKKSHTTQTQKRRPTPEERMDAAQEIRRVLQRRSTQVKAARKNRVAMLTTVSCMLCVACVCMSYALIRNINRLHILETNIDSIQTAYTSLSERLEEVQVQAAFAIKEQTSETITQTVETVQNIQDTAQNRYHVVQEGETLGQISRLYYGNTNDMEKIMKANGMTDPNLIVCGQKLLIP